MPRTETDLGSPPTGRAPQAQAAAGEPPPAPAAPLRSPRTVSMRAVPVLLTLIAVVIAGVLAWLAWNAYMAAPWTRDGAVRAYVVTTAPEVSGRIVALPIHADQFVHKGDTLLEIDPTDYTIALHNAEAALEQADANVENARLEAERRRKLSNLSTSIEEQQSYATRARIAEAGRNQAAARLDKAKVDLARTRLVSPVNGYVTNLAIQAGDYATAGQRVLSIVDTDSFWVDGYFEETQLRSISIGDPARISLMGYPTELHGHVAGISRGIRLANAQADPAGLATVNPIFTWIRLAQRVPVRIEIDHIPPDVTLAIGLTATVQIEHAPPAPL